VPAAGGEDEDASRGAPWALATGAGVAEAVGVGDVTETFREAPQPIAMNAKSAGP
jgi:hypothetical protein